jgi:hypothetical protein
MSLAADGDPCKPLEVGKLEGWSEQDFQPAHRLRTADISYSTSCAVPRDVDLPVSGVRYWFAGVQEADQASDFNSVQAGFCFNFVITCLRHKCPQIRRSFLCGWKIPAGVKSQAQHSPLLQGLSSSIIYSPTCDRELSNSQKLMNKTISSAKKLGKICITSAF